MGCIEVTCWRVYGWGKGRWTLRSTHATESEAREHAEAICHQLRIRTKVERAKTRRAIVQQPSPPSAARRFREEQSSRMVIRKQAFAYFKSGSNGTEILDTGNLENTP